MVDNKQAFADYLLKEKNYSPLTARAYLDDLCAFEKFIQQEEPGAQLHEVVYGQVRGWIIYMSETEALGNRSINRKISSLKSFYKFLLKIKQITVSPLQKHKALKTEKKVLVPFSEKEMQDVVTVNDFPAGFEGVRNRLVLELFYTTGMRRAELIGLTLNSYDAGNGTIKVLGKRNKERIVPLLPCTIALLKEYLQVRSGLEEVQNPEMLILNNRGKKLNETFVYRLINCYFSVVSAKVKRSPHVLRHTFATHLLNNGADLNSVKELLGHASLASTQVYTHSSLAELKAVYKGAHPRNAQ